MKLHFFIGITLLLKLLIWPEIASPEVAGSGLLSTSVLVGKKMNEEEGRIISRSKELLGKDRLNALEGKGRSSRIQDEVRATETALKALQTSLRGSSESKWQKRAVEPGENASVTLPTVLRSPRSITRELASPRVIAGDSKRTADEPSNHFSQSCLSKEAQMRIAQICVVHGAADEKEKPSTVSVAGSDSIPIWSGKCQSGIIDLDKTPFPELGCVPVSQRRELAPHISTIYDQVSLDFMFKFLPCY